MRISSLENLYFRKLFGSLHDMKMKPIEEVVRNEDIGRASVTVLICTVPAFLIFFFLYKNFYVIERFADRHDTAILWAVFILVVLPILLVFLTSMETNEDLKKYDSSLNNFFKAVNFRNRDNPETYEYFCRIREEMIQVIDLGGVPALESLVQSRFAYDLIEWIVAIERGAGGIGSCGTLKSHKDAIEDLECIVSFSKALGLDMSRTERFLREHTISYNIPVDEEYILEYP